MFAPRYFASRHFARRYFPRGSNTAVAAGSTVTQEHRFASAIVPSFDDLAEVQRFMQRLVDDVSRAMNPVRSVVDGGTGVGNLGRGEQLVGGDNPNAFTVIPGNKTTTRKVLVSVGNGVDAGIPFWDVIDTVDIPVTGNNVLVGASLAKVGTSQVVIP
jgi:hypothetical protein